MKKLPPYEVLKSLPVSRLLLSAITGVLLARYVNINWQIIVPILILSFLILFYFQLSNRLALWHFQWLRGFVLFIMMIIVYFIYTSQKTTEIQELPNSWYYTEVLTFPLKKDRSTRLSLKLLYAYDSLSSPTEKAKMIAYFDADNENILYARPGDKLLLHIKPEIAKNQGNPFEFDYASYLKSRGIFYTSFIEEEKCIWIKNFKRRIRFLPEYIRNYIKTRILHYSNNKESASVLLAITMGSKDLLDRHVKTAYAKAGGIHVMAVSGLHVGMIWLFLGYLLSFLGKGRRGEIIRSILVIFVLWFYALMTGLSPSVTRSALMFSLINIGQIMNRHSSVYNTLLLAAFIQLTIKPEYLYDPGFQFSYLAVLSIVYFHPLFRSLLPEGNRILNKIMDLAVVSISAQILTFPLAIFYFNQFPLLFILTNFILIPLVTIIMMLFLSSCLFVGFPLIYQVFLRLMLELTDIMNASIFFIEAIPGAVIQDIYINDSQLILLFISILLLIFFREYKITKTFLVMQISLLFFFISGAESKMMASQKNDLIVYNCGRLVCIGIHSQNGNYLITNALSEKDSVSILYATENYRIKNLLKPPVMLKPDSLYSDLNKWIYQCILPGGKNVLWKTEYVDFLVINNLAEFNKLKINGDFHTNVAILADPEVRYLKLPDSAFSADQWVLSSAVPWYVQPDSIWSKNQIEIFDVRLSKAYIYRENN